MRGAVAVQVDVVSGFSRVGPATEVQPRLSYEPGLVLRPATADDAPAIHRLITGHLNEGHLLPRQPGEIAVHASRFIVVVEGPAKAGHHGGGEIVGCADLAPLSHTVAEIRSLIVSAPMRSNGVGRRVIEALIDGARAAGFERLCAFTHAPSYFVRLGFSLVPHEWLPEKVSTDCGSCALFRTCGQYAVMLRLGPPDAGHDKRASLHG